MRVLVVDDSRAMRRMVARALRQAGFPRAEVVEAGHFDEALAAALDTDSPVDLVLSNWNMPGPSGLDLLNALRDAGQPVRFIMVTCERGGELRELAANAGASAFITKPFSADEFTLALADLLPPAGDAR
jgi:two-component system chemotaxis response regulator CheY